jgi:Xaa-Pro aminopeptidase
MRRYHLDVLVATSPVNITYFTDYHCWIDPLFKEYMMAPGASSSLAQAYAVFPLEGEPALVVSPLSAVNAADLWVRDLHIFGDPGLDYSLPPATLPETLQRFYELLQPPLRHATSTDALLSILAARGLTTARIGMEMEGLTPPAKAAVLRGLPNALIKDCSNLIRLLRAVKSPDEISRLQRAAEISEQAAMESLALARPGRPATDMVQHYRARVAELGAAFDHFTFGMRGMGFATEPHYVLADDDLLEVDFGCIYRHCFSDSGTTLSLRTPPALLLEWHAHLLACIRAGQEKIAPGVKASAVRGAMWETLNAHGITASFPHGHGLGLEVRDYPIIVADNGLRIRDDCVDVSSDLPLETDMVINLEAAIRMPTVGSLHIEHSFLVTTQHNQLLVPQERSEPYISSL